MEFNEKLQELRKQKDLTQEELVEKLFVSRTAISKWEAGRGYPNIESLKAISSFFGVTIDELLSGEELLTISEKDNIKKENRFRDIVFGLLDVSVVMLVFLPFFGQKTDGIIRGVSILFFTDIAPYLKTLFYGIVLGITVSGIATLALQNCEKKFWVNSKRKTSLFLNIVGAFLFVISRQPYAATFLLIFLIIKLLMLIKWR